MTNVDDTLLNPLEPDWNSVAEGTRVYANDGTLLGTVREKQADGLLVHGGQAGDTDYLVPPADIAAVKQDGVHLIINPEQAMRAHWQGTSTQDTSAPGGMAPGAMTRADTVEGQPS